MKKHSGRQLAFAVFFALALAFLFGGMLSVGIGFAKVLAKAILLVGAAVLVTPLAEYPFKEMNFTMTKNFHNGILAVLIIVGLYFGWEPLTRVFDKLGNWTYLLIMLLSGYTGYRIAKLLPGFRDS